MKRSEYICDLCGKDLYTDYVPIINITPIRAKVKVYEIGIFGNWTRIDVCFYCKQAIIKRSKELRSAESKNGK